MIRSGKRYIVALLTSIGLLLLTVIQTNFSITNTIILNGQSNEANSLQVHWFFTFDHFSVESIEDFLSKIRWSSIQLAYLNSIFYFGYVLSHIPSGFLVHQYSATRFRLFSFIFDSIGFEGENEICFLQCLEYFCTRWFFYSFWISSFQF